PIDKRHMVELSGNISIAVGGGHTAIYQQAGTVYTVGRGNEGQLGDSTVATVSLPVQTGRNGNNAVKSDLVTIKNVTGDSVVKTYDGKPAAPAVPNPAPDYLTLTLGQYVELNVSKLYWSFSDGFNLYKDGYRKPFPANTTYTYTSSDERIGVVAVAGDVVTVKSADGATTGSTVLTITATAGGKVLGVGRTKITFAKNTHVANPAISAGVSHSAAVAEDGSIWTWGDNTKGQLGAPLTTTYAEVPMKLTVKNGANAVTFRKVYAANGTTYAIDNSGTLNTTTQLHDDGHLWAWGKGYGATPVPVPSSHRSRPSMKRFKVR
ncbi:MAG: hypothetical protein RSB55_10225, partial [Oscillospiraceae bacterium]